MVQREVGERLAAAPGTPAYGVPLGRRPRTTPKRRSSVSVPASVFVPMPKVDSALVELVRRDRPPVDAPSRARLSSSARAGLRATDARCCDARCAVLGERTTQASSPTPASIRGARRDARLPRVGRARAHRGGVVTTAHLGSAPATLREAHALVARCSAHGASRRLPRDRSAHRADRPAARHARAVAVPIPPGVTFDVVAGDESVPSGHQNLAMSRRRACSLSRPRRARECNSRCASGSRPPGWVAVRPTPPRPCSPSTGCRGRRPQPDLLRARRRPRARTCRSASAGGPRGCAGAARSSNRSRCVPASRAHRDAAVPGGDGRRLPRVGRARRARSSRAVASPPPSTPWHPTLANDLEPRRRARRAAAAPAARAHREAHRSRRPRWPAAVPPTWCLPWPRRPARASAGALRRGRGSRRRRRNRLQGRAHRRYGAAIRPPSGGQRDRAPCPS